MPDSDEKDTNPIRESPFKKFLREQNDKNVGDDAANLLRTQLKGVSEMIWARATELAEEENGMSTVKKRHVSDAYDEFVKPQSILMDAADDLEEWSEDLKEQAEETPLYRRYDNGEK